MSSYISTGMYTSMYISILKLSVMHVGFCPIILLYYGLYDTILDAIAYSNAHYGQGTGPILLDNLACTGAEYNLTSCSYDSDTSDCRHYEDAGVHCNATCG